jgi:hypothetical protein
VPNSGVSKNLQTNLAARSAILISLGDSVDPGNILFPAMDCAASEQETRTGESNLIFSVSNPVDTTLLQFAHRIRIYGLI